MPGELRRNDISIVRMQKLYGAPSGAFDNKSLLGVLFGVYLKPGCCFRVCLKNGKRPSAVLLPVRFVGPFLTALFGDARNGPSRAQPKTLADVHSRFFRQTLRQKQENI